MTARDLIKRFEGYRSEPYLCPAGKPTIGWGHTHNVSMLDPPCTEDQAESWLAEDIEQADRTIALFVSVPISTGQREALRSFIFNLGAGKFATSTLRRKINEGDFAGAAEEFPRWVYSKRERLPGLVTRRAAERVTFLS